ncbi:hypothetical protein WR25_15077 [Diploscapter pachys]|uniref:Cytochrome c oxidase polypeptide VIIc n=1 Tax=Diploscapter pachys TaxID=2018661 RepID=A0A2A2JJN1_9BILA|nr:hypothetical protein WR25_15077 [Diploscapter pachys]
MLSRPLLSLMARTAPMARRAVHKGIEGTPPLRHSSSAEKVALYLLIAGTFLSYPTWVLLRLDDLRPRADNNLSEETQAELDRRQAAKEARIAAANKK